MNRNEWVKVGMRYINLSNVAEVHVRDHPRSARVFFVGGAAAELDEDDTVVLLDVLNERALVPEAAHRTVLLPPST